VATESFNKVGRVLKNKNQAVRQGARRYDKRSIFLSICEHWREPRNAEWRPQAQFFNTLLDLKLNDMISSSHSGGYHRIDRNSIFHVTVSFRTEKYRSIGIK